MHTPPSVLWNQGGLVFRKETLDVDGSRAVNAVDVDGDGRLDLVFTHAGNRPSLWRTDVGLAPPAFQRVPPRQFIGRYNPYSIAWAEENQALRNDGTGHFAPAPEWGLGATESGRGMSFADLDNDGDLDIVVNNFAKPSVLFENRLCGGAAMQVELHWEGSLNSRAIGAQLRLHTDGGRYVREMRASSGYISSLPARVHFGLGDAAGRDVQLLEVVWPTAAGRRSTIRPSIPCSKFGARWPLRNPPPDPSLDLAKEIAFGEVEGGDAHPLPDQAAGNVVGGRVDAAPDAGQAALVRGVPVGGPLQRQVDARAILEHQELVLCGRELPDATGKERVAG